MTITRLLARPMLATIFVAGGINALRNTELHASKAKKVADKVVPMAQQAVPRAPIPTDPATLVRINAGAQILADIPLGRVASTNEIAETIRWLAIDAPPSATGAVIDVNGASYVR